MRTIENILRNEITIIELLGRVDGHYHVYYYNYNYILVNNDEFKRAWTDNINPIKHEQ